MIRQPNITTVLAANSLHCGAFYSTYEFYPWPLLIKSHSCQCFFYDLGLENNCAVLGLVIFALIEKYVKDIM